MWSFSEEECESDRRRVSKMQHKACAVMSAQRPLPDLRFRSRSQPREGMSLACFLSTPNARAFPVGKKVGCGCVWEDKMERGGDGFPGWMSLGKGQNKGTNRLQRLTLESLNIAHTFSLLARRRWSILLPPLNAQSLALLLPISVIGYRISQLHYLVSRWSPYNVWPKIRTGRTRKLLTFPY